MSAFANSFANSRCWHDFVTALQVSVPACVVTYPMVIEAVQRSRAWFSEAALDARTRYSVRPVGIQPG